MLSASWHSQGNPELRTSDEEYQHAITVKVTFYTQIDKPITFP